MLNVSGLGKDQIKLAGSIDGTQDFNSLLGVLPSPVTLDCGDVTQINSTGIKAWMRYFCAEDKRGLDIRFENLSIPLVEQLNMFRNFVGIGKVVSIAIPFRCEACNINFSRFFPIHEAIQFKNENASIPCAQCGSASLFDDLVDEYFEFLARGATS